jgi:RNA-binding protein
MPLTQQQKKALRNLANDLKPVVMIGQHGLTENVLNEIELSINHHELIKVKVNANDREQRQTFIEQIAEHTRSDLVHRIGHIAVFYRRNPQRNQIHPGKE